MRLLVMPIFRMRVKWTTKQQHCSVTDSFASLPANTCLTKYRCTITFYKRCSYYIRGCETHNPTHVCSKYPASDWSSQLFEVTDWQVIKDTVICLNVQKYFVLGGSNSISRNTASIQCPLHRLLPTAYTYSKIRPTKSYTSICTPTNIHTYTHSERGSYT